MQHLRQLGPVLPKARHLSLADTLLISSDHHTEQWSLGGERLAVWEGGRSVHTDVGILSTTSAGVTLRPGPTTLAHYGGYGSVHGAHTLTGTGQGLIIRRLPDLAPLARVDAESCGQGIASPDGRHLAVWDHYRVTLIALPDRSVRRAIPTTAPHVAFSPDGQRMAVASPAGLLVVPTGPGEPLPLPPLQLDYECRVIFLDNERLVVSDQGNLWLWDGGGRWQRHQPPGATDERPPRQACPMAVRDGVLVVLDRDGAVNLWAAPGARAARPVPLTLPTPEPDRLDGAVLCLVGTFTHIGKQEATARIQALGPACAAPTFAARGSPGRPSATSC
jgi:hypothetical protein